MLNKKSSTPNGKVIYNSSIIRGIVNLAIADVEGVSPDKINDIKDSVKIKFLGDDSVSVDVTVSVAYGVNIPDVAYNIQQSIKHNVETMSDYKIQCVDVNVVDVIFDEARAD